jgi:hypothetical protein
MDLENMKDTWQQMSQELENQKKLTSEIILKMTNEKSSSRLNRIVNLEIFGNIISWMMLFYIIINFDKLTSWLSLTGGIGTSIILIIGSFMSLIIIKKAKDIDLLKNSYVETLRRFDSLRKTLRLYKKLSIYLNIIMPFLILPLFSAIFLEKDLLENMEEFKNELIASFLLIPPILYLIIRYYSKNISKVKEALDEIEE